MAAAFQAFRGANSPLPESGGIEKYISESDIKITRGM